MPVSVETHRVVCQAREGRNVANACDHSPTLGHFHRIVLFKITTGADLPSDYLFKGTVTYHHVGHPWMSDTRLWRTQTISVTRCKRAADKTRVRSIYV